MSRTYKDIKQCYGGTKPNHGEFISGNPTGSQISNQSFCRNYAHFKRYGPPTDELDACPSCGGCAEYHDGYMICRECGWVESAIQNEDLFGSWIIHNNF